jgi:LCP family protein required for cell wall assembly
VSPGPRADRRMLLKAFLAGFLIILFTAGASSTAALLKIDDIISGPEDEGGPAPPPNIVPVDPPPAPGNPQTLLLVGSDGRWADEKNGDPARSDTLMLVRLDPDEKATTVLSLPRDLQVQIPGHGLAKINDAFALGGPNLTAQTIKSITGLHIHHIVNVNFKAFREVVNAFNCFYADVDRTYFHSNVGVAPSARYDAIDVKSGYQKLCGIDALDYARFRHADSDLTRAARQQDFLRAAKGQVTTNQFLRDVKKFSRIARRYMQTDKDLRSTKGFLQIAKLAYALKDKPVRQVEFPAGFAKGSTADGLEIDYVTSSQPQIAAAVERFMTGGGTEAKAAKVVPKKKKDRGSVKKAQLVDASTAMQAARSTLGRKRIQSLGFSFMLPRYLTSNGRVPDGKDGIRTYSVRDRDGKLHRAYRLVVTHNQLDGQYYGVQGIAWKNPPILDNPSVTRTVKGRKLLIFRAGAKLRLVAWKTDKAAYWVSNTLNSKLSNAEMLALASSVKTSK